MPSCRVLRVSPEDDILRVLRQVKEVQEPKLCLAISDKSTLFRDNVNLRLLAAYAREASVVVVLSTGDEMTIRRAAEHGISTYRTPDLAFRPEGLVTPELAGESTPDADAVAGPNERKALGGRGLAIASIFLIALLGVFGTSFALLPRVHVGVVPAQWFESLAVSIAIHSNERTREATEVELLPVSTGASIPASGNVAVGDVPAKGIALFINEEAEAVTLPAGTIVTTDSGAGFVTAQTVEIPGRVVETYLGAVVGLSSGRMDVPIEALEPGEAGNVGAGQVRHVVGDWPGLDVRNPDRLSGGADRLVPVVTEADMQLGEQKVLEALAATWEAALIETQNKAQRRLLFQAGEAPNVIEVRASAAPGDRVDQIEFDVFAEGELHWITKEAVEAAARDAIATRLGTGYAWQESHGFDVDIIRYNKESQTIELAVQIPVVAQIDEVRLARRIAGLSAAEIAERLADESGIADVRLDGLSNGRLPAWAPWIGIEVMEPATVPELPVGGEDAR